MLAPDLSFLVVEDQEFQRSMLVRMLGGLGARTVHTAGDGGEALRVLAALERPPDIILTDLNMPGMDGIEFIRHLGLARGGASLIVVSALERSLLSSVATMARAYGVDLLGFVEKPITPRKLEELVSRSRATTVAAEPAVTTPQIGCDEILRALAAGQFEPYFLPKVEIATSRVLGAEALARWNHPEHGVLGPQAFLGTLEASGNVHLLFREILRKSARLCRALRDSRHYGLMCINLSIRQLSDTRLAEEIGAEVRAAGIAPTDVALEVTESAATDNMGPALENLARLRMKGFTLAIDDYGTGYSSLEQLTRIPFTELKIDQSFVRHADRQESAKVILESSIEMTRKLKIRAIAEGVESQAHWDLLRELQCDAAQGYFISRPLPAHDFVEWLKSWERLRVL